MHNIHCKSWVVTAIYFRRLPYKMTNEGQVHLYLSVYLYFDETIFNIDLCTLVTKYTLIFTKHLSSVKHTATLSKWIKVEDSI